MRAAKKGSMFINTAGERLNGIYMYTPPHFLPKTFGMYQK